MRLVFTTSISCTLLLGCSNLQYEYVPPSGGPKNIVIIDPDFSGLDFANLELPSGFTHIPGTGIDSALGKFVSGDCHLKIGYDIGDMAGVLATNYEGHPKNASLTRTEINGLTALTLIYRNDTNTAVVVSFPDARANFFTWVTDDRDIAVVKNIVSTFNYVDDIRQR